MSEEVDLELDFIMFGQSVVHKDKEGNTKRIPPNEWKDYEGLCDGR